MKMTILSVEGVFVDLRSCALTERIVQMVTSASMRAVAKHVLVVVTPVLLRGWSVWRGLVSLNVGVTVIALLAVSVRRQKVSAAKGVPTPSTV